ncbi:hypothetical protein [Streptomyces sp. NPDC089915]|uniref:hypothetical protein n=1 Tax=Streptomyces sp. NPDC089915 TaxID=3155186 RepID=UPI0034455121
MPRRRPGRLRRAAPRRGRRHQSQKSPARRALTRRRTLRSIAAEQCVLALLLPDPYPRSRGYVLHTRLMWEHPAGLWVRLRELMAEHGLTPRDSVLVYLFPDGSCIETGVLLSGAGRVYDFELTYDREEPGAYRRARFAYWHDITDGWRSKAFGNEIRDAFVWRPPAGRTFLSADEPADEPAGR